MKKVTMFLKIFFKEIFLSKHGVLMLFCFTGMISTGYYRLIGDSFELSVIYYIFIFMAGYCIGMVSTEAAGKYVKESEEYEKRKEE